MKKNKFFLTIAIPTYNRHDVLKQNIDNIINNVICKSSIPIELVISDNASTDNTKQICQEFQKKYDFIKYFRNEKNFGIDFNIMKAVQLSTGKYVHLLSDDDIIIADKYLKMLNFLTNDPEIDFLFLNGRGFSFSNNKVKFNKNKLSDFMKNSRMFMENRDELLGIHDTFHFKNKSLFIHFIGTYITLISCFLLKREIWNINKDKGRFIGTDIYLSYDLLHHISNSNKIMFYYEPVIGIRQHFTKGNYRVFYAFSKQLNILLLEEAVKIGFDKKIMESTFKNAIRYDLFGRIVAARFYNYNGNYDSINIKALSWILPYTYKFFISYITIYPILLIPKKIYLLARFIKRKLFGSL